MALLLLLVAFKLEGGEPLPWLPLGRGGEIEVDRELAEEDEEEPTEDGVEEEAAAAATTAASAAALGLEAALVN